MSHHLKALVAEGLHYLTTKGDVEEAEIFASVNGVLTCRINYTSHLPCNGLEEPKSIQTQGVGLRIAIKDSTGVKVGFGQETGSLSLEAVESAYLKAKEGAVHDPDFYGLPEPSPGERSLRDYHDDKALRIIMQNVALALLTKGVFLVLGVFGLSSLWLAIFADDGAALIVILNSLRLLNSRHEISE